jgi:hypothetical protein
MAIDPLGLSWTNADFLAYYYRTSGPDWIDTETMGLTSDIWNVIAIQVLPNGKSQIEDEVNNSVKNASGLSGSNSFTYNTQKSYSFGSVCFSLGYGSVFTYNSVSFSWYEYTEDEHIYRDYYWLTESIFSYSDSFQDPLDIGLEIGKPYGYDHEWNLSISGAGTVVIE